MAEIQKVEIRKRNRTVSLVPAKVVAGFPVAEEHSPEFFREAKKLDEKIIKSIERMQRDVISLGELFDEMMRRGYYRVLKGADGETYRTFRDYLAGVWPDQSASQVFQAMRIVRNLSGGDKPIVSREDVREMPRFNAEGLARLKDAGQVITPELIQDAKVLPIREFKTVLFARLPGKAQEDAVSRGTHLDTEPEVFVKRTFTLSGVTASKLAKCIKIAQYLTDATEGATFDDRVFAYVCEQFLAKFEADYDEVMGEKQTEEEAEGKYNAVQTEDELAASPALEEPVVEKKEISVCQGKKSDGTPCGSPAVNGSGYCYYHKPKPAAVA